MLDAQAREAVHPDELETVSKHWLYERRIVIPGKRRIEDWARDAFPARLRSSMVASFTTPSSTEYEGSRATCRSGWSAGPDTTGRQAPRVAATLRLDPAQLAFNVFRY